MSEGQNRAFEWYLANQDALVKEYDGKVLAIKDGEVLGVFDTELTAVRDTRKRHDQSTFIVQRVSEGDEAYTATFRSRVVQP